MELDIYNSRLKKVNGKTIISPSDLSLVEGKKLALGDWKKGLSRDVTDADRYINIRYGNKYVKLHRYLMHMHHPDLNVLDNPGIIIDHLNGLAYDNRFENLDISNHSKNSQNREKIVTDKSTSKYIGVSRTKVGKYSAKYARVFIGTYMEEVDAARAYDMYVLACNGINAKTNGILAKDEVEKAITTAPATICQRMREESKLPKGVTLNNCMKYQASIWFNGKRIYIGCFETPEEAGARYLEKETELKSKVTVKQPPPIKRNADGIALLEAFNKQSIMTGDVMVDDEIWHSLWDKPIYIRPDGYPIVVINGKNVRVHRHVHGVVNARNVVDHINNNPLDNRKANLREATYSENGHNKVKIKNASSIYRGVHLSKQHSKYQAYISHGHRRQYIGWFTDETEAARAYDAKAIEIYGNMAKLNFPHE